MTPEDMVAFTPDEVRQWLSETEAFVERVSALAEKRLREEP